MFSKFLLLLTCIIAIPCARSATTLTLEERLKQADQYRFSIEPSKSVTHVNEYENGALKKSQIYHVYTKPGVGSLALFMSSQEAGQKVLIQNEKFWIFMPHTKQPLRISPMQKLLGDASVGDLATLSWSSSYNVAQDETKVNQFSTDYIYLTLEAKVPGVTYQKINLTLNINDNFPVSGEFYLKSGKLAKKATFIRGSLNNSPWVTEMTLENTINSNSRTIMQVVQNTHLEIPDKVFNPSYLIRNNFESL